MSRAVALTVPADLGTEVREMIKPVVEEAFHRANNRNVRITEEALNSAVDTAIEQAQKSLKERHNLLWKPDNQYVAILDKEDTEDVSDEEADQAIEQVKNIIDDSSKISGKSLVSVLSFM